MISIGRQLTTYVLFCSVLLCSVLFCSLGVIAVQRGEESGLGGSNPRTQLSAILKLQLMLLVRWEKYFDCLCSCLVLIEMLKMIFYLLQQSMITMTAWWATTRSSYHMSETATRFTWLFTNVLLYVQVLNQAAVMVLGAQCMLATWLIRCVRILVQFDAPKLLWIECQNMTLCVTHVLEYDRH